MRMTEYAVSRAIIELQQKHQLISYEMVANHIGSSVNTVGTSVIRMMECGALIRLHGSTRAGGYRYEYSGK